MPSLITIIAMVYIVLALTYLTFVPDEDYVILVGIVGFVIPLTVLSYGVDKIWRH